jgi:hypothetical protein
VSRRVLYVRDDGEVVGRVTDLAQQVRAARPGTLTSDADVARQLLHAAMDTPAIVRRLIAGQRKQAQASAAHR